MPAHTLLQQHQVAATYLGIGRNNNSRKYHKTQIEHISTPVPKVAKSLSEEARRFTCEDKLVLAIALCRKIRVMKHESEDMNATLFARKMNELAGHDVGYRQGRGGTVLPKVHICSVEVTAINNLIVNFKDDPSGRALVPLHCRFEDLLSMRS
jgi:hypothetical protein